MSVEKIYIFKTFTNYNVYWLYYSHNRNYILNLKLYYKFILYFYI